MITFFKKTSRLFIAVESDSKLSQETIAKLTWLFSGAKHLKSTSVKGTFIGPRAEMTTPWSTNATEITRNMGIEGISRIEEFEKTDDETPAFDRMLRSLYHGLNSRIFTNTRKAEEIVSIEDIRDYNLKEGLALSPDEQEYLMKLAQRLGRPLTDSEVFGFSQVNSEHCRHKIFNGTFVIDGEEKPLSLFKMIKQTSPSWKDRKPCSSPPRIPSAPTSSGNAW